MVLLFSRFCCCNCEGFVGVSGNNSFSSNLDTPLSSFFLVFDLFYLFFDLLFPRVLFRFLFFLPFFSFLFFSLHKLNKSELNDEKWKKNGVSEYIAWDICNNIGGNDLFSIEDLI